jgi:hypothetical protein
MGFYWMLKFLSLFGNVGPGESLDPVGEGLETLENMAAAGLNEVAFS